MGEKTYALRWKRAKSYPIPWRAEPISNGEEHSISFRYSMLSDPNRKQQLPGPSFVPGN